MPPRYWLVTIVCSLYENLALHWFSMERERCILNEQTTAWGNSWLQLYVYSTSPRFLPDSGFVIFCVNFRFHTIDDIVWNLKLTWNHPGSKFGWYIIKEAMVSVNISIRSVGLLTNFHRSENFCIHPGFRPTGIGSNLRVSWKIPTAALAKTVW